MVDKTGELTLAHRDWLIIFERVVASVKAELKSQGREDQFYGARVSFKLAFVMTESDCGTISS